MRAAFARAEPWLNPAAVGRLVRLKRRVASAARQSPAKLAYAAVRDGYRNHVRRWLSAEALDRISAARRRALALVGREPHVVPDPPCPRVR